MTDTVDLYERLTREFHGGDDRELWSMVAHRVAADVAALDTALVTPPRHLLVVFARTRRDEAGAHPDDHPSFHLAWERDRGDEAWRFAGENPRTKRKRGHYVATVCVPADFSGHLYSFSTPVAGFTETNLVGTSFASMAIHTRPSRPTIGV